VVICTKIVSTKEDISNIPAIPKIGLKEEIVSKEEIGNSTVAITTITPVFTDIESNGEIVLKEEVGNSTVATTTTALVFTDIELNGKIVSKEEVGNSTVVAATTTTLVFTDIDSNGEIVSKEDVGSSLNEDVAAAATDDGNGLNAKLKLDDENLIENLNGIQQEYLTEDVISSHGNNYYDNIDNAKSPPICENLIVDLDGIRDETYQVKRKCNLIYDRSDDVNPPLLPPESPAYAINIPTNGEILLLPLCSPVYRMK